MSSRTWSVAASFWLAVFFLGCTNAYIEPTASQITNTDNKLTLEGQVCTSPPDVVGFPVKVVVIIDKSGSMCVSDPPGSQGVAGFCEQVASMGIIPPGVTEPARVRALKKLLAQFSALPNVSVSIIPFETSVSSVYPSGGGFGPAASVPQSFITDLQAQLGKGTDYQGAFASAQATITQDIITQMKSNPEVLPRTRYVVVFLTDGTPYPRCSAIDSTTMQYADPDHPELIWADSSSAVDFCNEIDPDPQTAQILQQMNFLPGTDRNQNYQIFARVDQIMELKNQYNVGDIRIHSVLLFNEAAVRACGTICQDLYGVYPNTPPAQYPQAAKKIAGWLLNELARRGNGVYQEFVDGEIQSLGLGALDYSSLASRNVLKAFYVRAMRSDPSDTERVVDSDGDGVSDDKDNAFTKKTSAFNLDSDGDCFSDRFEILHGDRGFDPAVPDGRGCDPAKGCQGCRDTDGDGVTQFEEDYLGTDKRLVDTDGDGITDGIEAVYGLDPQEPNGTGIDTDGDGVSDHAEILADADPTRRDKEFFERYGYQYETTPEEQPDGSMCYHFAVGNLTLVTPPNQVGVQQGFNLFRVYFAEAPESGVTNDYGVWRSACVGAQYDPPVRNPVSSQVSLTDADFHPARSFNSPNAYNRSNCAGMMP